MDFENAFNRNRRGEMLRQVELHAKELYPMLHKVYSEPLSLSFSGHEVASEAGCQQGDVAAPLAFYLLLHPLVLSLQSGLTVFYLDDGVCADADPANVL